jgi:hypothetical protein
MRHFSRPKGRLSYCLLFVAMILGHSAKTMASDPSKTIISDTIYRADGSPASGTMVISWPAFVTAEAVTKKDIVDVEKFRGGLGQIIDGTVQCLNASAWAKAK